MVSPRTGRITAPLLPTCRARMQTPVGPNAALHTLRTLCRGGMSTVPCSQLPEPRSVMLFVRICTLCRYTPARTRTMSPGRARLTAAWMDCPGDTTIVVPPLAGVRAAADASAT